MVVLIVLLCIIAAVIAAVFFGSVAIFFLFDTVREEMSVRAQWLGLVRLEGTAVSGKVRLSVRLAGLSVYSGTPKPRKRGGANGLLGSLSLKNSHIKFSYGSTEPSRTGLFCAAGEFVRALLQTADVEIEPVFIPQEEFLIVEAETRLNVGKTLYNLMAARLRHKKQRRYRNGPVKFNR